MPNLFIAVPQTGPQMIPVIFDSHLGNYLLLDKHSLPLIYFNQMGGVKFVVFSNFDATLLSSRAQKHRE